MNRTRLVGGLLILGLLVTGCAARSAAYPDDGTRPLADQTIPASQPDSTALLHLGNTLVFSPVLGSATPSAGWTLFAYPKNLLRLTSKPGAFPFTFTATHSGIGQVRATFGPLCKPGPYNAGVSCPVAGAASTMTGMPVRMVSITVKIYAQGG